MGNAKAEHTEALRANKLGALWATLDRRMATVLLPHSGATVAALLTLHHWAPMNLNALAAIVGWSQPAASRAVDKMVQAGWVDKTSQQGHEWQLRLTSLGQRAALETLAARQASLAELTQALSADEQTQLDGLLDKLLAAPVDSRACARQVCRFCDHRVCDGADCPVGCAATALEGPLPQA